eukprot:276210-Prymnesium_polylepis.2
MHMPHRSPGADNTNRPVLTGRTDTLLCALGARLSCSSTGSTKPPGRPSSVPAGAAPARRAARALQGPRAAARGAAAAPRRRRRASPHPRSSASPGGGRGQCASAPGTSSGRPSCHAGAAPDGLAGRPAGGASSAPKAVCSRQLLPAAREWGRRAVGWAAAGLAAACGRARRLEGGKMAASRLPSSVQHRHQQPLAAHAGSPRIRAE